jgi:hypothetical protein
MKSSIRSFALRFAVTVVLFAPGAAAQAQGNSQTVCRYELVPTVGMQPSQRVQVCNTVYYPPPPPPPPEPPVRHTTGSETTNQSR